MGIGVFQNYKLVVLSPIGHFEKHQSPILNHLLVILSPIGDFHFKFSNVKLDPNSQSSSLSNTRGYSPLCGLTSSSCRGLRPTAKAFLALSGKKWAFYAVFPFLKPFLVFSSPSVTLCSNLREDIRKKRLSFGHCSKVALIPLPPLNFGHFEVTFVSAHFGQP